MRFTAEDFGFVLSVLSQSEGDKTTLLDLLSDENERDSILDLNNLHDALVDGVGCLQVTPAFYFYVTTRRVLLRAGLDERALADYVAAVLAAFAETRQIKAPFEKETESSSRGNFLYVSDMLSRLAEASPTQAYEIRLHLGNYALFFSGLFAERVKAHAERRGAPGLSFYDGIGQASYDSASRDPRAKTCDLQNILKQLASHFSAIREALNELADSLLHLHPSPIPIAFR